MTRSDRAARLYDFQSLLELAAIRPGARVLDLGTGTGALLRRLAARADAPREAVGVDRSASMLAAAWELPNAWRLVCAIARRPPGIMAGLRVLHPRGELTERGFCVRTAVRTGRGYPSLVVVTERRG